MKLAKNHHCKICDHRRRHELELDYLDWTPIKELAKEYKVAQNMIRNHVIQTGLRQARISQTKSVCERVIERGMNSETVPSWQDVLSAVKHVDKLEGRLVDRKLVGVSVEERDKEMEEATKGLDRKVLRLLSGEE